MSDSERFWLRFWIIIVSGIVAISMTLAASLIIHEKNYIDAGYEQTTVVGYGSYVWTKKGDN